VGPLSVEGGLYPVNQGPQAPTSIAKTIQFEHLIHADWSIETRKRWLASAVREHGCWCASAPSPVGPVSDFLQGLLTKAESQRVLAGFDFPIGVPHL
jgi:hypothetical protein